MKNFYFTRKTLVTSVIILLLSSSVIFALWQRKNNSNTKTNQTSQQTDQSSTNNLNDQSISSTDNVKLPNDTPPVDTNTPLKEPSGVFVSNHKPNLSGSPAPNLLSSQCITTAGATCEIQFKKDGAIKMLNLGTTNNQGVANRTWQLQEIGITDGSWQITAVAKLGNQIKSTTDTISLEVKP